MRAERHGDSVLPALAAPDDVLSPPRLPPASAAQAALARPAAAAGIPLLLVAPVGAGRLALARALHAVAGRAGPLLAATGRRLRDTAWPADATLFVDVTALAPDGVLALEALLDDAAVWVLATADPAASLPAALAPRLQALVVTVPPLGTRLDDLPALAAHTLERLAARAGRAAPRLTPAALAQLAAHPWTGDLAELDAILARGLLAAAGETIDVAHLGVGVERPAPALEVDRSSSNAEMEALLGELAHELRNPLVTIKTFARHLPQLMEDAELRARFATLCDEAVERMDGVLENVLSFARLGPLRRQALEVPTVLARVVTELGSALAPHAVRVEETPGGGKAARCSADPEYLAFALRNLLVGVAREMPAREDLVVDTAANGVVSLRLQAGTGAGDRLRRLIAPDATADNGAYGDPTLLPLAFRLARAALERGGGALEVRPADGDTTMVVVRLPTAPVSGTTERGETT